MRVLVVEDEPTLAHRLKRSLDRASYAADLARSHRAATDLAIEFPYDLIVLGRPLPDGSGLGLLRQWRSEGLTAPVLILSTLDSVADKVAGLEAGADDYLTRPFAWAELLARLGSLLRRRASAPVETLVCGDLTLDRTHRRVSRNCRPIELTTRELALLEHLMLHPGRVISRTTIADHVWDRTYEARSNTIDVLIGRIRRKLEAGGRERVILTVKGLGYLLKKPQPPRARHGAPIAPTPVELRTSN